MILVELTFAQGNKKRPALLQALVMIGAPDRMNPGTGLKQYRSRGSLLPIEIGYQSEFELEGATLRQVPRQIPINRITEYAARC